MKIGPTGLRNPTGMPTFGIQPLGLRNPTGMPTFGTQPDDTSSLRKTITDAMGNLVEVDEYGRPIEQGAA